MRRPELPKKPAVRWRTGRSNLHYMKQNPVSLRLDDQLLQKARSFARRRKLGLTTALRMIVSEHLEALDAEAERDAALRWQQERAWTALERWEQGKAGEVSLDDLRRTHQATIRRTRRR